MVCLLALPLLAGTSRAGNADEKKASKDRLVDCRVSGSRGSLPGAKITVTLSLPRAPNARQRDSGEVVEQRVYRTDLEGKYRIRIAADLLATSELLITVRVAHPEHLERTMGPLPVSELVEAKRVGLNRQMARQAIRHTQLRKMRVIRGRILLPDGKPAAGARVSAQTRYRAYSWKFFSPNDYTFSESVITDRAGRFAMRADRRISMTVFKSGQAPLIIDDYDAHVAVAVGDPPKTLRLPKAIVLQGQVLDDTGAPVPRAIVSAQRHFQWNEANMPLSFGRRCVADKQGRYRLPPLPADKYKLTVTGRLSAGSDLAAYNRDAAGSMTSYAPLAVSQRTAKYTREPLDYVFLPLIKPVDANLSALDLTAVTMVRIKTKVVFPDGAPDPKRHSDVGIAGRINGRSWQGRYVQADKDGIAVLLAPRGLGPFMIKTGTAFHRRGNNSPLEIGQAIHFRDLDQDLKEITVVKRHLATLEVKLSLPADLQGELSRSKAHISITAAYVRKGFREQSAKRQTVTLTGSTQRGTSAYRGRALPGEPIRLAVVLRKDGKNKVLHEQRLTLRPDEVRALKIQIGKPEDN